jgi:hypothetical protein
LSDQPPKEFIRYLAGHLKLQLAADELPVLEQVVQANEEYLVVIDATTRTSAEDPLGFMRFVHSLEAGR